MKILDIINSPWAIDSDYLVQISNIYINHLKGEKIDFKSFNPQNQRKEERFSVINNTAIIPINGPLTPGASFFSFFFGGTSMLDIKNNIQQALDDGNDIILYINSPGGTVEGTFELADFIENVSRETNVTAYSDGQIASAAMLIASSASKIFISGKTNQIGSIGVISRRLDFSKANEQAGVVVEEIVSGKFKNISSPDKKIEDFDRTEIQAQVDYLFTLFAQDFSRRRNMSTKTIDDWQARIFIGEQAIENKLVDGVATLDELIYSEKGLNMTKLTLESFKSENSELFTKINDDAYAKGLDAGVIIGKEDGAKAERERIAGIEKAAFPKQEVLKERLINDGKTSPGEAAIQFNAAQKEIINKVKTEIINNAPEPVVFVENQTPEPDVEKEDKDFMYLVDEYQKEKNCSRSEAMKTIIKSNPKSHQKYINKIN
jgi:signal peptide peptidase SppA